MTGSPRESTESTDPLPGDDPFDVLGIKPSFDVDLDALKRRVRRQVAALHPDRFTDPLEVDRATRETARLNEAWKSIGNDEHRANLLLVRLGGPAADQDRSLPEDFLQQMLSVRFELEQAVESRDAEEIARLTAWSDSKQAELRERVRTALSELEQGTADPASIRLDLNVWRYIQRMRDELASASGAKRSGG
ncbi:MAG: hypothetical protein CBC35_03040 [Planctomycetes bacterium TMED75]|nr:hypothetical protein [Planctomycetaceae bacterium]OUU95000.1 MAG: hypothetical protein CBC35_03040 [Planctomycetes bacterium TMED75]